MFFQRLTDPIKIQKLQSEILARRLPNEIKDHLKNVRRVVIEGPFDAKFAPIWDQLSKSPNFKRDYADAIFKYGDSSGRPHLLTGAEAIEELYRDITSKHTQLLVLSRLLKDLLDELQRQYNSTKSADPDGAVRVKLGLLPPQFQLYVESLLHTMKATLDIYALFTDFMYAPRASILPGQMNDQIKFFRKEEGHRLDPDYSQYMKERMDWFYELKSLRDGVSHFGSAMLQAEEADGRINLSFYTRRTHLLENKIPYSNIEQWIFSFLMFCEFYKAHFTIRLAKSQ